MQSSKSAEAKFKKNILILDCNFELEKIVKEPLLKQTENTNIYPTFVRAKDGVDAALKTANQKFDMIIIDMDAPRLMEGGFFQGLNKFRNTQEAQIFVISQTEISDLPQFSKEPKFFKKPVVPDQFLKILSSSIQSETPQGAAKSGVDVRVVNAIITSTLKVFSQFGISSINMEKPLSKLATDPLLGEVSSVIEIRSDSFHGNLSISFDKNTFLELVSSMLMEEQTDLTSDNQDAVGEINNIIFGNAKSEIASYGVQVAVPRIISGAKQCIPCTPGSAAMLVPFSTTKGKFFVTVVAKPGARAS
ncbi:MAG: chemotaxis protein CheX [Pseudobdellovibrionaceae bacterium]